MSSFIVGNPNSICPIVMACDEGYAMPLATAMRSIVESNSEHWPMRFFVLCDQFHTRTKEKVLESLPARSASIEWIQVDVDQFHGLKTIAHISAITYARILIGDLIPKEIPRVLYLDADLLVLGDLTVLCDVKLNGSTLGAVPDAGLDLNVRRRDANCVGMPSVQTYFNAGVLLIDMDNWRNSQIGGQALAYLTNNPDTPFADQDALNAVLDGEWQSLPEQWNFQRHMQVSIASLPVDERPAVVHFVSAAKPWKRQFDSANFALHDEYRRRTRFARSALTDCSDAFEKFWVSCKRLIKQLRAGAIWSYTRRNDEA